MFNRNEYKLGDQLIGWNSHLDDDVPVLAVLVRFPFQHQDKLSVVFHVDFVLLELI